MDIGLQTFTIRNIIKNRSDSERIFQKISAMGIKNIELAVDYLNFPFTPETADFIKTVSVKNGINIASCQIKYTTYSKDYTLTNEFMKALGCPFITNSVIDVVSLRKGKAGVSEYCRLLNDSYEKLGNRNITLGHHNHHYEFLKFSGECVLKQMKNEFKGEFVLDTYWCQKGGGNPITLLDEFDGRIKILHLRDFKVEPFSLLSGGSDAEIGNGNIPFEAIINKASKSGVLYGMIEQKTKTPLESLSKSLDTVSKFKMN